LGSLSSDFYIGFAVATLFWLLVSQMVRIYYSYMRRIKAARTPLAGKVPSEVIADANRARLGLVLWFLIVLLVLFLLWEFLTWGTSASLFSQLFG
jgi:hypothetical protein